VRQEYRRSGPGPAQGAETDGNAEQSDEDGHTQHAGNVSGMLFALSESDHGDNGSNGGDR
jgi:hypothetical protein